MDNIEELEPLKLNVNLKINYLGQLDEFLINLKKVCNKNDYTPIIKELNLSISTHDRQVQITDEEMEDL